MKIKLNFFGTHDFGASMLQALADDGNYEITAVVTQPDRPTGRKQEVQKSPVKILAEQHGLRILQPETLKNPEFKLPIADLNVVCQYGLIIPKFILESAKHGSINVHTSLLPKYRGASPIQSALINGEKETGITVMQMDEKMDHGAILARKVVPISPDDTYTSLRKNMIVPAQNILLATIPKYLENNITPEPQNNDEATYCKIFTREDGKIDWNKSADEIHNLWRGLTPWPGIWTSWNGKRLKLLSVEPYSKQLPPGEVQNENKAIIVGTAKGSVKINELQLEGKKSMDAKAFLAGQQNIIGAKLS